MRKKKVKNSILIEMQRGFKAIHKGMQAGFDSVDRRFDSIDRRFNSINGRFQSIDRRFVSIDRRFTKIGEKLSTMSVELSKQRRSIKQLVTKEEFKNYRNENNNRLDEIVKTLEKMDAEAQSHIRDHNRVKEQVDIHEKALKNGNLLPLPA